MRESTSTDVLDRLEAEDLARARWYSFFSRWFLAPPDQQALELFVHSDAAPRDEGAGSPAVGDWRAATPPRPTVPSRATVGTGVAAASSRLESAWQSFAAAVGAEPLEAIRSSYDDTFISVGEAPVSLHASVYLTGFANERPLAEVRRWLAKQGIQSSREGLLTEDHLGLLCEAMAWLIIGHGDDQAGPGGARVRGADDEQQHLFCRYIAPVCDEFCERLSESSGAGIYRELGHLFAAFCAVERQAFEIER